MLRSILFSVVALAAAGTALAHDGERWERGGHERQEWRQPRGEWRHECYDRDDRYYGYREHRPVVRYYAPEYYAPAYYGPRYNSYPEAYGYGQVVAPAPGLSLVIPLR
jgi:hypothetical protein